MLGVFLTHAVHSFAAALRVRQRFILTPRVDSSPCCIKPSKCNSLASLDPISGISSHNVQQAGKVPDVVTGMIKTKGSNGQGDCGECIVERVEILWRRCGARSNANLRYAAKRHSCFSRALPSSLYSAIKRSSISCAAGSANKTSNHRASRLKKTESTI